MERIWLGFGEIDKLNESERIVLEKRIVLLRSHRMIYSRSDQNEKL
ncbi:hypothetical protein [Paenibacillus paridis]|nr:hypothetical protein [Paenibacillus paridis]